MATTLNSSEIDRAAVLQAVDEVADALADIRYYLEEDAKGTDPDGWMSLVGSAAARAVRESKRLAAVTGAWSF